MFTAKTMCSYPLTDNKEKPRKLSFTFLSVGAVPLERLTRD